MKKLKFSIKLAAAVLVSALCAQQISATTIVFTSTAGAAWNSTNLFNVASRINSVKIDTGTTSGATNLTFALIDSPITATGVNPAAPTNGWGPIFITNAAYTASVQFLTNITKTVTNFAGLGQSTFPAGSHITNIITLSNVLFTTTNVVGATSNLWRRVAVGNVSSNSVLTLTGPFTVDYGLGFTNNSTGKDIILTIDYDPNL